jgi:hypothetical protein
MIGIYSPPTSDSTGLALVQVATNPGFNVCREAIDYLTQQIRDIEAKLVQFQMLGLPMQLIHGDLHYDNVMVSGGVHCHCLRGTPAPLLLPHRL